MHACRSVVVCLLGWKEEGRCCCCCYVIGIQTVAAAASLGEVRQQVNRARLMKSFLTHTCSHSGQTPYFLTNPFKSARVCKSGSFPFDSTEAAAATVQSADDLSPLGFIRN